MNSRSNLQTQNGLAIEFPTDYQQIIERLNDIDPIQYSQTRNYVNGAVTYLSPYISRGIISVKQVMDSVLKRGFQPLEIEKFLQELAWRDFFQRVFQHVGDDIWKDMKQPQPDVQHHQMIESVYTATTGIEAIDEAIKNLYTHGYMHNHVRMYTASMTCNMAKAHWLNPSKWMYYHLLDGDIASNTCSWQWVAAAFASKKYYFNQENVNKYTFSKKQNTFIDRTYDEITSMPLPDSLQPTMELFLQTKLPLTGLPNLDRNKPTLIYNSYNLDRNWRNGQDANRLLILEPSHFKKYPVSQRVIQFVIDLSKNIEDLHVYVGEIEDIVANGAMIISKEHPLFVHYPGLKDSREWMFPKVTNYFPSFFAYWKQCKRYLN